MTQLHLEQCELTYEGAFVRPVFSLVDSPGKLYDLLLEGLAAFGCTSADLVDEEGEPGERGATCEVDQLDARVTVYGDRIEVHCAAFVLGTTAKLAPMLENVSSCLAGLSPSAVAKTHSVSIEADAQIRGSLYQELLNRLARAPDSLPPGTETAIVYYLPDEISKGYRESSLVLNRSAAVERGLQFNATLVFEAQSVKPAASLSAAENRLRELLRGVGLEWAED